MLFSLIHYLNCNISLYVVIVFLYFNNSMQSWSLHQTLSPFSARGNFVQYFDKLDPSMLN